MACILDGRGAGLAAVFVAAWLESGMTGLASLSKRLEHLTRSNVLAEIKRWMETGQSIFLEELATLQTLAQVRQQ